MTKVYQRKEWFEKMYLNDHLNCREIGDLLGVSRQVIWKKLKTFGIPIRPRITYFFENGVRCHISQGYLWIFQPEHPRANGQYVKRAVLALEQKLGRSLVDGEFPHHKDNDRMNDDPANLEITDRSKHMADHQASGDIDTWANRRGHLAQRKAMAIDLWNKGYNTIQIIEQMHVGHNALHKYLVDVRQSRTRRQPKQ